MKKQLKRYISRFLVIVFFSNIVIIPDTKAMAIPVPVAMAFTEIVARWFSLSAGHASIRMNQPSLPVAIAPTVVLNTGAAATIVSFPHIARPSASTGVAKGGRDTEEKIVGAIRVAGAIKGSSDVQDKAVVVADGTVGVSQASAAIAVVVADGAVGVAQASAAIANKKYIKLVQEQIVVKCPYIYSPTPYVPKIFDVSSIPDGMQAQFAEFKGPYVSLRFPSTDHEAQWAASIEFGKVIRLRNKLRHNAAYKSRVIEQEQEAIDCLLRLHEGSLAERIAACGDLQSLHIDGLLNELLADIVRQVKHHYVHSDGELSISALLQQEKAASLIEAYVKATKRITDNAIQKNELINPMLYEQLKHYKTPHRFADDLSSCLKACKKYDFDTAKPYLIKYGEDSIFQEVIDLYTGKYQALLNEAEAAIHDANGIVRVAQNDPLYRYCTDALIFSQAMVEQKLKINADLLVRQDVKTTMHEKWGISQKVPDCVHEAMYTIMGADSLILTDVSIFQQRVGNVIKAAPANGRDALIDAFYFSNGVLKEYAQHLSGVKNIKMPKKILAPMYDSVRKQLNDLMYEQIKSPSKGLAIQAACEHLNGWIGAKNTKDAIECKDLFNRAYTNVFNTYSGGIPPVFSAQTMRVIPVSVGNAIAPTQTVASIALIPPYAIPEQAVAPDVVAPEQAFPVEVPAQAIPESFTDVQSSMPMPPTPQGPELEPEKKIKPVGPEFKPKAPEVKTDSTWDMPETGKVINGRYYTKHALERMAPDTPQVRAELLERALKLASDKGLKPGTKEFFRHINEYIQPRNIPPLVVEETIKIAKPILGSQSGTLDYVANGVKVVLNEVGQVITIFQIGG